MRFKKALTIFLLTVLVVLAGCSRDPNVAKKRYLDSGNKYFDKGQFKQARIMYMDALQKDQRYGPAYYKLGLTYLQIGPLMQAVNSLRRAVELLPKDSPERRDSMVKLSEVYLLAGREQKPLLDEVGKYCQELLKRDPNSFDGVRLTGDLDMARAVLAYQVKREDEGAALVKKALQEYERANTIKPGSEGVMLQLARAEAQLRDFAKAEETYKQVIEKNKTVQTAYGELYRLYVVQRKLADAEQLLKLAFQNNPKQFNFLTTLALHYSLMGRKDEMMAVLQQVKSHAAEYPNAYKVVGDFYLRQGDADSAIREYKEGIAKDPKRKIEYEKRVIEVYLRQNRRAEAAQLNDQILKEDPKDSDAISMAASLQIDKGDITGAIANLSGAVTRTPQNAMAHFELGRAYAARGEYENARLQLNKTIELSPNFLPARRAMAQLQLALHEFDAAIKSADQILRIDKNSLDAQLVRAAALMGQQKTAEAHQVLQAAVLANPTSATAYFQLGAVNLLEKNYKESAAAFRKSQELDPANPRAVLGLVETEVAQGRPEGGMELLRGAAAKSPNNPTWNLAIGNLAGRMGKYDESIQAFNKTLDAMDKNSKQRADVLQRIAEVYRRKGDDATAITYLQKAHEVAPESVPVIMTLGIALDHAGRTNEARQAYENALKLDANNAMGLNNLAFLLAENNGDLDDALSKAQKAKQLLPNMNEVSDTLGWIYVKKHLNDNALDIFQNLVSKAPKQSTFRYHLGVALYQKGDKPNAIKELNEALKNNPPKPEREKIQQMLTRLNGA